MAQPYWLGGRHNAAAALRSGRAHRLAVAEGARGLERLLELAAAAGVPVQRLPSGALRALAGPEAQGCAALVQPLKPLPLEQLLGEQPPALLVACDHLQDPHNLGAVARTLEAAGGAGLILPLRRACPVTPAAERAAAGAFDFLPWAAVHNLAQALDHCRRAGFWVFGADPDAAPAWGDEAGIDWAPRSVLVVGSEGRGLAPLSRRHCDRLVALPLLGRGESLNASVAAGILVYDWVRWRQARASHPADRGQVTRGGPRTPRRPLTSRSLHV